MIDQSGQVFPPAIRQSLGGPGATLTFMGIIYASLVGLVAIVVGAMSPITRGVSVAILLALGAVVFGPLRFRIGSEVTRYLASAGRPPK